MEDDVTFLCNICNKFGGKSFRAVLRHIGEIHSHSPNFFIRCGIHHCPQTYKNFHSFRSHVYRKHRDVIHTGGNDLAHDTGLSSNEPVTGLDAELMLSTGEQYDEPSDITTAAKLQKVAATFLLKTREEYRIPQSTVNKLLQDVTGLVSSALDHAKDDLIHRAEGVGENFESIVAQSFDTDVGPFEGLQTEYQQTSYYKNHFNYLVYIIYLCFLCIFNTA